MKQFNVSVSFDAYPTKPNDHEVENMIFLKSKVSIDELADVIKMGHACCQVYSRDRFMTTNKNNKNFKKANLIVLDFDHCPISYTNVLHMLQIKPSIGFETFSNKIDDNRFKLIYLLDNPITTVQEYKKMTELVFSIVFNETDRLELRETLDITCYRATQMFNGTDKTKQLDTSETIISLDLINQVIQDKTNDFKSYEEVFEYLNIPINFTPKKTQKNKSIQKAKSKSTKKCPKKRNKRIKLYNTQDFTTIPNHGTVDDLFDMGVNNDVFFIKSEYNNYDAIYIDEVQCNNVYFYVGNQNIYAVNTYFRNGKQKKGSRKRTLQYTALVFRNLYPAITENEMFTKLRNYAYKYFEQPNDLDNDWIRRLANSTVQNTEKNDAGKKCFVLNPQYNYLTKTAKIKEVHKAKTVLMTSYILNHYKTELTLKQNAELLHLHHKTVKKYLEKEGLVYNKEKVNDNYNRFVEVYSIEENKTLSLRKLEEMCKISKTQIARYIEQYNQE